MTARNATADWHGAVETGSGRITVGDGVFEGPYSAQSRFNDEPGTNPEQLIPAVDGPRCPSEPHLGWLQAERGEQFGAGRQGAALTSSSGLPRRSRP